MSMSENVDMNAATIREVSFPGEASMVDKAAFICDLIMLGIFICNQMLYGMNMLFLIIPLVLVGLYLLLFCVISEEYCFTYESLEIRHRLKKTVTIPYDSVFNYEASVRDTFINITQSNKVKVYHESLGKKRCTLCTPKDVTSFVDVLKKNCPEFHEESKETSALEVFLKNKE